MDKKTFLVAITAALAGAGGMELVDTATAKAARAVTQTETVSFELPAKAQETFEAFVQSEVCPTVDTNGTAGDCDVYTQAKGLCFGWARGMTGEEGAQVPFRTVSVSGGFAISGDFVKRSP